MTTERTTIDPWPWSTALGYHQGEVVSGHARTLYCAGQAAMGGDDEPRHADDMAARARRPRPRCSG